MGQWWPQGKEVFLFSPPSLFFLLCPLDPEDSCRGKQFSTLLSVEERWSMTQATPEQTSVRKSAHTCPYQCRGLYAALLGTYFPCCSLAERRHTAWSVQILPFDLSSSFNSDSRLPWLPCWNLLISHPSIFPSFNFVLLLQYAILDITLGYNLRKDTVHNCVFAWVSFRLIDHLRILG